MELPNIIIYEGVRDSRKISMQVSLYYKGNSGTIAFEVINVSVGKITNTKTGLLICNKSLSNVKIIFSLKQCNQLNYYLCLR